jgi:hypothetical protein
MGEMDGFDLMIYFFLFPLNERSPQEPRSYPGSHALEFTSVTTQRVGGRVRFPWYRENCFSGLSNCTTILDLWSCYVEHEW